MKMFTNGQNMGLPLQVRVKKTFHWLETNWLTGKEKIPSTAISKEGHADSLLGQEGTVTIYILEKGATVNCYMVSSIPI